MRSKFHADMFRQMVAILWVPYKLLKQCSVFGPAGQTGRAIIRIRPNTEHCLSRL
jgi:hypothetical protein